MLIKHLPIVLLAFIITGCVSIPKQSAELSAELATMIRSARSAHLELVNEYMRQRREQVDQFMAEKWIPTFMKKFTKEANILGDLEKERNSEEKSKLILEFSEAAQQRITERRTVLIEALSEIEDALRTKIEEHYDQMLSVNQVLTAHLRSAEKVVATRDEILRAARIQPEKIIPLETLNRALNKVVKFEGQIDDLKGVVNQAKETILEGEKNGQVR